MVLTAHVPPFGGSDLPEINYTIGSIGEIVAAEALEEIGRETQVTSVADFTQGRDPEFDEMAILARKTLATYGGGMVQRYHTHPIVAHTGQMNSGHQWGVAVLVLTIWPDASRALVVEAISHDAGERWAGDDPAMMKWLNPQIVEMKHKLETEAREKHSTLPMQDLTPAEKRKLKLCDKLECILWCAFRAPRVLEQEDWVQMAASIVRDAAEFERDIEFQEIIEACYSDEVLAS